MDRTEKARLIDEIAERITNSTAVFIVDYKGVNVEDISRLRREFRKEGVSYKVYKNTLVEKALEKAGKYPNFTEILDGMNGFVFAGDNFVAPAKIIKKYFDDKGRLALRGCYIESDYYTANDLSTIASMPTKDEIMSSIVGSIAAPASGIVGAINAVIRDLVSVVDQISKKEAA
ncbi:MAG: 50S ribosomal protein L10 [Ignavibacteriales bacterium]|nr:50S ribosomal protein L10 [Ignavibacteriales bacterium]MCF8315713.1 50S ribosomal protein L10 [Ignavibacteriales bacterium]MCF8437093.1 50S ribosomal protein L10 [Ignavibacteriales bacterium]